jgi:hypothetical protein
VSVQPDGAERVGSRQASGGRCLSFGVSRDN